MVSRRHVFAVLATFMLLVPSTGFSTCHRPGLIPSSRQSPNRPSPKQQLPRRSPTTTSKSVKAMGQYAGQAISLFNNMKTPASIIAGALVPLGFLAPIQLKSEPDDTPMEKRMRKFYYVLSAMTLATELIAVMWATVATNGLTERPIAPAESVWHLLKRDFELEWAAVNTHFVVGMFGFLGMIASRAYFMAGKGLLGKSVMGIGLSGLALMVSIVNRGVAAGGGPCPGVALRYGSNVLGLGKSYVTLLIRQAFSAQTFGPVEILSVVLFGLSIAAAIKAVLQDDTLA